MVEKVTRSFLSKPYTMYIRTKDTRLFTNEWSQYGREYMDAVGEIYKHDRTRMLGIIKTITPELPRQTSEIPVSIEAEEVQEDKGIIVLKGKVDYTLNKRCLDSQNLNGKDITLEVYLSSAKTIVI